MLKIIWENEIPITRIINGKKYVKYVASKSKPKAVKDAALYRDRYTNARVIMYNIYSSMRKDEKKYFKYYVVYVHNKVPIRKLYSSPFSEEYEKELIRRKKLLKEYT